jgi:aminoglycoside phosphotransferase (APT) family kinase protein
MSRSRIYKEILKVEIEKIITDLFGNNSRLLSAEILKGGLFNTTYLLHTNQEKSGLVLRVGPVNKHLLFEFEKDMMAAEPFFHKLFHENGIPTSKILKYSPENSVIEREYIIVEFIHSIPMNDESLKDVDLDPVYEEIGRLAHLMHKVENRQFGWLRPAQWGLYDKWYDFILAFATESADKAEDYHLFPKEEIEKFRSIVSDNENTLNKVTTSNYVHSDLWQGNILLSKENGEYKVAAIIDLDRTIFGDRFLDFSTPWLINDSFMRGYHEEIEKDIEYQKRQYIYDLLWGFFGSYVWQVEYDEIECYESEKEKTIALLSTYSKG